MYGMLVIGAILAVFIAGILLGDADVPHKKRIERFHTSLASLAEIVAFVALGLTVDLTDLARAATHAVTSGAAIRDVEITLSAPKTLHVVGDPDRIRQAIDNLLTNALRHSPAGGTVTVSLEMDGEFAQFTVIDEWPGFAPEFIPVAFERFTRGDHARSRSTAAAADPGGNGLGLAIVRAVMAAHHGTAAAANVPNGGARVTLRWPAVLPGGLAPSSPAHHHDTNRGAP